jgi:hypothetical protein
MHPSLLHLDIKYLSNPARHFKCLGTEDPTGSLHHSIRQKDYLNEKSCLLDHCDHSAIDDRL